MNLDLNPHRKTLHQTLGIPDKIHPDYSGIFRGVALHRFPPRWVGIQTEPLIGFFDIVVKKSHPDSKGGKTRVFLPCKCGRDIPVGRLNQHKCGFWPPPITAYLKSPAEAGLPYANLTHNLSEMWFMGYPRPEDYSNYENLQRELGEVIRANWKEPEIIGDWIEEHNGQRTWQPLFTWIHAWRK